jgi:anti-anti-sigma factor
MALNVTSRLDRHILILTGEGNLTLGPHLRALEQTAKAGIDSASPEGLVVDLSGINHVDSAGLGALTILYTICNKKACILVLMGVPAQVKQMFDLTRLDALLPCVPDLEAAKAYIKSHLGKARDAAAGE